MAADEGRRQDALAHWRSAVALDPGEYSRLLTSALSLVRAGRAAEATAYLQLFAESAPPARYGADIARVRQLLRGTAPSGEQR
jgi:hypothetical protein